MILFPPELGLLEVLMLQVGRVVSKDKIAQCLSTDQKELGDNAIEVYIHRLRKRIKPYDANIRAVRGLRYMLESVAGG
ncbi:MAG: winged helix-turn-helix domain-containing protein [Methylicorpusculum sp.]|uniref:winged helix-turn-helix domain-containing protein n=1 Tax=Methylicorpusculum sp. TaxID=2713644 RepID=UPI00271E709F|nr:winged helix-turn-helix domain-containing protein [Methylicorpusculum sp.]MDO8939034.1 winged helix-turn-helix domain-containing protein [Methylicorpusculum sp.]MDO9238556.1 winged helix-turn-helix domain-containing protein [Methylicorpusculum sp.]MDP2177525.1 winged helix-turn-helix domain-containing protein [Methylicorpusculum sp.]MDP3531579.1 winged helix-turn-helix domain-containing protein [Methylicorpusculum sp.]